MKAFYNEILETLAGKPAPEWFRYRYGICLNYEGYLSFHGIACDVVIEKLHSLYSEFKAAGLDTLTPFNTGDSESYAQEAMTETLYQNPARLAWIREHAK